MLKGISSKVNINPFQGIWVEVICFESVRLPKVLICIPFTSAIIVCFLVTQSKSHLRCILHLNNRQSRACGSEGEWDK